jgi:hypothetical protein
LPAFQSYHPNIIAHCLPRSLPLAPVRYSSGTHKQEWFGRLLFWAKSSSKEVRSDSCQWLMPVVLATQEAEIRRILVWSQLGQ